MPPCSTSTGKPASTAPSCRCRPQARTSCCRFWTATPSTSRRGRPSWRPAPIESHRSKRARTLCRTKGRRTRPLHRRPVLRPTARRRRCRRHQGRTAGRRRREAERHPLLAHRGAPVPQQEPRQAQHRATAFGPSHHADRARPVAQRGCHHRQLPSRPRREARPRLRNGLPHQPAHRLRPEHRFRPAGTDWPASRAWTFSCRHTRV